MTDRDTRLARLAAILVVAAATIPFVPALSGDFVSDDVALILSNARVRSPSSLLDLLASSFWDTSSEVPVAPAYARIHRPLIKLAYHLQFRAFGESAAGFHAVSLLLHAGCSLLVLDGLRARLRPSHGSWAAALVGALAFAVHPTRAESVAWISGSTDVWMTWFVLLAARAVRDPATPGAWVLGGLWIALAGFAKEPAWLVPIPVAADVLARTGDRRRAARALAVCGAAAAVPVIVWAWVVPDAPLEVTSAPAMVLATVGHYVRLGIWPWPSSFVPVLATEPMGTAAAVGAVALATVAALVALAPRRPGLWPLAADALWIVAPLVPVLNLVVRDPGTLVHERFLYLPLFGACSLAARGFSLIWDRWRALRAIEWGVALAALAASAVATVVRAGDFTSEAALWAHEIAVHPSWPRPYAAYVDAMRSEHAFSEAAEAALAGASVARVQEDHAWEAVMLLKWARTRLDAISDAEQAELRALRDMYDRYVLERRLRFEGSEIRFEVAPFPPTSIVDGPAELRALVLVPRAQAYLRTGELDATERQIEALLEQSPRSPEIWNLLALVRARRGDFVRALEASDRGDRVAPGSESIRAVRDAVIRARDLAARPVADAREAAVRDAQVQLALGAPEAARRALAPVLDSSPTDHFLVHLRAQIDVTDRRFDLARQTIERARSLAPDDPFFEAELRQLAIAERSVR